MSPPPSNSADRLQDAVGATKPSNRIEAVFGSTAFFRLWIAQLISATGDWLGLIAIISLAERISDGSEGCLLYTSDAADE